MEAFHSSDNDVKMFAWILRIRGWKMSGRESASCNCTQAKLRCQWRWHLYFPREVIMIRLGLMSQMIYMKLLLEHSYISWKWSYLAILEKKCVFSPSGNTVGDRSESRRQCQACWAFCSPHAHADHHVRSGVFPTTVWPTALTFLREVKQES